MTRPREPHLSIRCHAGPVGRRRQAGLTLLELVIAATLGLLVLSGVLLTYIGSGVSERQSQALSRMTEDAQLAMAFMTRELQMAGYMRITAITPAVGGGAPQVQLSGNYRPVFGCDEGFVASDAAVAAATCNAANASNPGTPSIEVTHEVTAVTSQTTANGDATDCQGSSTTARNNIVSHRFFVAQSGTGAAATYELQCAVNGGKGAPLVPHVAKVFFTYGFSPNWDRNTPSTWRPERFVKASGVTDWNRVVAVRICLLMRSPDPVLAAAAPPAAPPAAGATAPPSAADYIDCEGKSVTSTDRHLYRAFKTTVTLRNQVA